jgi:alcohol dehydrogenase class IV
LVCVPTTSGTGSEATRTAVLAAPDHSKVWLWGDQLKPGQIVLDPALTVGLPPSLTAATGIDALVHAIEAATNANANVANDLYCHEAIRLVVANLLQAIESPADLAARAGMQRAATLAGIGIDNCGTAIAHNIGHALASLRPVHHGRAVGLALRATLAWNAADDAAGRFAAVAVAMGEPPDAGRVPGAYEQLLRRAGIRVSLAGEGHDAIRPADLALQMARPENEAMRRSNRRPVTDADLLAFAHEVLTAS